jgi:hypothetical protein
LPFIGALRPQGNSAHERRLAAHRSEVSHRRRRDLARHGAGAAQWPGRADSFDNAEADFAKRLLIEARNEAETILAAVERAPRSPAWAQLTSDEQTAITLASDYLKKAEQSENPAAIREATLILDHATRRFAELMMDAAVSSALRGKTMDSAGEELDEAVTAPHAMAPAEFK